MDTIFMNSDNSKSSKPHILKLKLTSKLDLRLGEKVIALSNLSIYYTWKNIKSSYNNNKFKISASTWNDEFELLDGSYSVSDIQDYFEYILKKHGEDVDKPSVQIYVNKIENVPHLEITELLLVHCNIANNGYQQDSRVLYTFVPYKPFGSLLEISPTNHISKTFNSEYDEIKVWFIDRNSQALEIEDRINLTMVMKSRLYV